VAGTLNRRISSFDNLITLYFIKKSGHYTGAARVLLITSFVLLGELAVLIIHSGYGKGGVLLVSILYIFRNSPIKRSLGGAISLILLVFSGTWVQWFGLLPLILFGLYNGKSGKGSRRLSYLFYPLHLLFLGILSLILF